MIILFGTRISPSDNFLSKPKYLALKSYSNTTQDLVLIDELHAGLGVTFRIVLHYCWPTQVTFSPAPLVHCTVGTLSAQ